MSLKTKGAGGWGRLGPSDLPKAPCLARCLPMRSQSCFRQGRQRPRPPTIISVTGAVWVPNRSHWAPGTRLLGKKKRNPHKRAWYPAIFYLLCIRPTPDTPASPPRIRARGLECIKRRPCAIKKPAAEAAARRPGFQPTSWPVAAESWAWGHLPLGALGPRSGQISWKDRPGLEDLPTWCPLVSVGDGRRWRTPDGAQ